MKKIFYLILIFLIFSCGKRVKKNECDNTFGNKIDSILLNLSKGIEFQYKLFNNDSTKIQKSFPLIKKVYYESLNLTFEFRQSVDCHDLLEIVICYNDSIIYGIPFRDNFYFWKYKSDTSKYNGKLSFEKELNNAIINFSNYELKHCNKINPYYSEEFVRAIMDNLTKFECRKIISSLDDFENIKKRMQNNINKRFSYNKKCKNNAISNIEKLKKLEREFNSKFKPILLYDFMLNDCIYCFTFEDFAKNGKYVSVNVVNKECYFDIIF